MESAWFNLSIFSRSFLSASALASASAFIFSISSLLKPEEASIRIACSLPVALSLADTFKIPLASISNVTSIWGTPRRAGAIPVKLNWPIDLFCAAIGRSPWSTWIVTSVWLSAAVEKVSLLRAGIVVFASINLVITPPNVSIPIDNGVTSSNTTPLISSVKTAPWTAAPTATTSSGLTPLEGVLPKNFSTNSWTAGIREEPPTRITSSISELLKPASLIAFLQGSRQAWIKLWAKASNLARVKVLTKCLGIPSTGMMYGRLISVEVEEDNSILAFSAASFRRCIAIGSFVKSAPSSFLNSCTNQSMITWSKSSPPKWVSPLVESTSNTPPPNSRIEISNVPPPRSNTAIFISLWALSRP